MVKSEAMEIVEECDDALANPRCPYVSEIKQQAGDIQEIKKALLGDDLQSGLIQKVQHNSTVNRVLVYLGALTLTTVIAVAFKVFFGL